MNNLPTPVIDTQAAAGAFPATLEQLHALGITDADIALGTKRGEMKTQLPWGFIRKYRAITMHTVWKTDSAGNTTNGRERTQFWPARSLAAWCGGR